MKRALPGMVLPCTQGGVRIPHATNSSPLPEEPDGTRRRIGRAYYGPVTRTT